MRFYAVGLQLYNYGFINELRTLYSIYVQLYNSQIKCTYNNVVIITNVHDAGYFHWCGLYLPYSGFHNAN